jgi:hypothetical protein
MLFDMCIRLYADPERPFPTLYSLFSKKVVDVEAYRD